MFPEAPTGTQGEENGCSVLLEMVLGYARGAWIPASTAENVTGELSCIFSPQRSRCSPHSPSVSLFAQPADLHRFGIKSPLVSRPKTYREAISWDLDGIIHKRCLGLRVALCQSPVLVSEQKGSLCVLYSMYWVGGSVCNNCGPL